MIKTKSFKVVNGRFHFKCGECQTKRMMTIGPVIRKRSIRCHKCKELTRCVFNRRLESREQQLGKVLLTITGGRELDASLYDNSPMGSASIWVYGTWKESLWEWRSTLDAPGTKTCWDMVVILSLQYVDTESEQRQRIKVLSKSSTVLHEFSCTYPRYVCG